MKDRRNLSSHSEIIKIKLSYFKWKIKFIFKDIINLKSMLLKLFKDLV
jgi:hypothetical protein